MVLGNMKLFNSLVNILSLCTTVQHFSWKSWKSALKYCWGSNNYINKSPNANETLHRLLAIAMEPNQQKQEN